MKKLILMLCLVGGCVAGPVDSVNDTPSVESLSGLTGEHNAGSFDLATGTDVSFVQVWCLANGSWYQTGARITDGLVSFQCDTETEWRARIVH